MEPVILNTVTTFATAAAKLEAHKQGSELTITLGYSLPSRYSTTKNPKIQLQANFYDGDTHQTVKAATLASLMDEVFRRCGFAEREIAAMDRVEQGLVALEAPRYDPMEI